MNDVTHLLPSLESRCDCTKAVLILLLKRVREVRLKKFMQHVLLMNTMHSLHNDIEKQGRIVLI